MAFPQRVDWRNFMWCSLCHQDVPGVIASADDRTLRCGRCGTHVGGQTAARLPATDPEAGTPCRNMVDDLAECLDIDEWEFEELLEQADEATRLVRTDAANHSVRPSPPLDGTRVGHAEPTAGEQPASTIARPVARRPLSSVPWTLMTISLSTFVCGSILTGWALLGPRPQLWPVGLSLLLAGQMGILAVVIWQFESVWQTNKATFCALHGLDDQVRQLERRQADAQTRQLDSGMRRWDGRQESGAEPHLPLADLQRRLETLSQDLASSVHRRSAD